MNIPKKRKIDVTKDSMLVLMQEVYNEIADVKNKALIAYKKYTANVSDNTDVALVGKVTNDLLKIMDSSIEKKLRLIKMQQDALSKKGDISTSSEDTMGFTEEDRKWIEEEMKKNKSDLNIKTYE